MSAFNSMSLRIRAAVLTELQLAAEVFLLLLIVPYYLIQILTKALENRWIVVPVVALFALIAFTRYRKLR